MRTKICSVSLSLVLIWATVFSAALSSVACGPPSKETIQKLHAGATVVYNQLDFNVSLPDELLAEKIITPAQFDTMVKYWAEARIGTNEVVLGLAEALKAEKPSLKVLAPIVARIIANIRNLRSLVDHEKIQRVLAAVEIGLRVLGSYFALQVAQAREAGYSTEQILAEVGLRDGVREREQLELVATAYDGRRFDEFAAALP